MAPKKGAKAAAKADEPKEAQAPKAAAAAPSPQKRKAEEEAAAPEAKEPKTEAAVEQEQDAKEDKRPGIKGDVAFSTADTTLNLVPGMGGRVLGALSEGAMQHLLASGRANVGLKAGRYMFEVRTLEFVGGSHGGKGGKHEGPRATLRVGFSTATAPLVLGAESEESVYFDTEGGFYTGSKKVTQLKKFHRSDTLAVVLNLDPKSPNKNTVSLFSNGQRVSPPQALPESLLGKPLFPHLAFRCMKITVNWGPEPVKALPFKCTTIARAAQQDTVTTAKADPKDGKYDVVVPVAFPDEGAFDWADEFLAKHPHFTELSDRMVVEWAKASGIGAARGFKASNDRSDVRLGGYSANEGSAAQVLRTFAGLVPRHYLVMEVKENLVPADRQALLRNFALPCYRKVAHVVMGEPKPEFKKTQQAQLLKFKQEKAEKAWKAAKAEKHRKKVQKEAEEKRKKAAEEAAEKRKKAAEDRKKKLEELKKKAEEKKAEESKPDEKPAEEKKDGDMDVDEEQKKEEEAPKEGETKAEEAKKEEEEEKKPEVEEESDDEPPAVELTDEDRAKWFAPKLVPDLKPDVFSRNLGKFALPEKAEGFDDIKYEWQQAAKAKSYLQEKLRELKKTTRVEDLVPGQWFRDTFKAFSQKLSGWQAKQKEYKDSENGKAEAVKRKKAEEKDETLDESTTADGDIFSVADVTDIGAGEPLFKDFLFEDWALVNLRFELFVLHHAFQKDVNDADRPGIPEGHIHFYYNKYFHKTLNVKAFGVDSFAALVKLVSDTVTLEGEMLGVALEGDDLDTLLKQTELGRRQRQRRLYAGDETARLKLTPEAFRGAGSTARKHEARGAAKPGATALTKPVLTKPGDAVTAVTKPSGVTKPTITKPAGVTAPGSQS